MYQTFWQQLADCSVLDGNPNDLELVSQTRRVFNVFDSLSEKYRDQIIPSVSQMARGMAYFQKKFDFSQLTLLEDESELEEYCYFVAGAVGEMLCNLFLVHLPNISEASRNIMQKNSVSFGLGLQMTNICKDVIVDRNRGWSYIPQSYMTGSGLTVEEFNSGQCIEKNMQVIDKLLQKTIGHLNDALDFTLAIPRQAYTIRLFCIWPLWMAMETVAVLRNNRSLIESDAPVKISRATVKRILRRTPLYCFSDFLLKRSFASIINGYEFSHSQRFNLDNLRNRLNQISLDNDSFKTSLV